MGTFIYQDNKSGDAIAQKKDIPDLIVYENFEWILWRDLCRKKDEEDLVSGKFYRIYDYVTSTKQENTQSAAHQFDIIVLATSESTLNENAWAAPRYSAWDSNYFQDTNGIPTNFHAWEIKYSLENDSTRFAWACNDLTWEETGQGYEIDSGDLHLRFMGDTKYFPDYWYDDNEHFGFWRADTQDNPPQGIPNYVWFGVSRDGGASVSADEGIWVNPEDYNIGARVVVQAYRKPLFNAVLSNAHAKYVGRGVIYYMKDEWGNEAPYDFKNIQFIRRISLTNHYPEFDEENVKSWVYTFTATKHDYDNDEWSGIIDGSLESPYTHKSDERQSTFHHNVIKPYIEEFKDDGISISGIMYLNDNVFLGYFDYNNNTDGYNSAYCCYSNTLQDHCYSNSFGVRCLNNTLGSGCNNNKFIKSCYCNTFGIECNYNVFGYSCHHNMFGNGSGSNQFGMDCTHNLFHLSCFNNTFGDNCVSNTFGNYCDYIRFGNSSSLKSYYRHIIIETGNNHIYLDCSATTSSNSPLRFIKIAQGVNYTLNNTYKTITHTTVNDTFQTIYRPTGSTEVNV